MLTEHTLSSAAVEGRLAPKPAGHSEVHKVAIVNGTTEILSVVESVLAAGHYDVVLVESVAHAYSHIKRVQPNLVVLCARLDDANAFQVLSMLKLDEDTRNIPVLTYTIGPDERQDEDATDAGSIELFAHQPAARMN
jgi:response regulator RpfG family c-di-GMP phosphodiesterase